MPEPEDARPSDSRVVSTPARPHRCHIDWEVDPETHAIRQINWNDPPGTIRECDECGTHWIAKKHPRVYSGQQRYGVYWERVRERRKWWRRG